MVGDDGIEDRRYHLWTEHERPLALWFAVQTQWVLAGMEAVPTGLRYQDIEALIRMRRLAEADELPELIGALQMMEQTALAEWARQRSRKRG